MPKISARNLEEHRAETVERLIDAWSELVLSRGYASVSLTDVAAQAGLARTAIYNYFPDREALLFAWTEREVGRAIDNLQKGVEAATTSSDKLKVFVRAQLEGFGTRHLPPGQEVMQFLRPETYGRFMQHIEPLEKILRDIISEGVTTGEFAKIDATEAVPMVMACIGSERGPVSSRMRSVDEATARVCEFVLRALGASPAKKKPSARKSAR